MSGVWRFVLAVATLIGLIVLAGWALKTILFLGGLAIKLSLGLIVVALMLAGLAYLLRMGRSR
jgi:hypothetical protein